MESERYSFSYGYIRSDWNWRDADEAYAAAVKHREMLGQEKRQIRIWRKLIEEVML